MISLKRPVFSWPQSTGWWPAPQECAKPTKLRVEEAAAAIGFYGLGAIKSRIASGRSKYVFGFLLLQPHRQFYQNVAKRH